MPYRGRNKSGGKVPPPSREETISRAMSYVLRHGAEKEKLKLDENGSPGTASAPSTSASPNSAPSSPTTPNSASPSPLLPPPPTPPTTLPTTSSAQPKATLSRTSSPPTSSLLSRLPHPHALTSSSTALAPNCGLGS
ncbi:MAG: hypothetical protein Q9190_007319 [Brigantiaea leucoxantha]